MQVIKTIREMQKWSMDRKKAGKTVAVVPDHGLSPRRASLAH